MKILIVADAAPILFTLEQFLSEQGYATVASKSADDALEKLAGDPSIRLVLCDLLLRNTNGIQLCNAANQVTHLGDEGVLPPPKFIFMAAPAFGGGEHDERLRSEGRLLSDGDVIQKPIDRTELLARIRDLVQPPRPGRSAPRRETGAAAKSLDDAASPALLGQITDEHKSINERLSALESSHHQIRGRLQQIEKRLGRVEKKRSRSHVPQAENKSPQ
jgi:DNA-binding response OmpR family regulator